ncbi:class I SAM-dependent RNA methyltransferase [Tianweitania populi]|uniref:RNA methyltransferase n=1 Tax=Tianweitania populi TaxID=1607949 RepID=A0A8J3GK82_9HYPH|nr:class I SAM-dependent RNA methyltransferase [Tianweitania populi]GHD05908.1 RNA methyltransferase [Tianweitania populi]
MSTQYRINHLGAQGDGIANTERGPVYIPFTLPDETVTAAVNKDRGDLIAIQEPAANRVEPPCRHFGTCGGCQLQHMAMPDYLAWKRNKVVQALKSQALTPEVGDIIPCAPHSRRRVTLALRKVEAGMLLGYNRHLSHEIIDIVECPISVPPIVEALESLRAVARLSCSTNKPFRMTVTATAAGLDVALLESGKLDDAARKTIADFALANRFARVSVDGEIIVEPTKPQVSMGASVVTVPPGGFLQAVASAEGAMAALVLDHIGKSKRVADLFAGSGAFSLRLAARAEVHAVEGDAAPLAALDRAFRFTPGLKRVTTEKRDLFERPLTTKELDRFDAVVFDPPRAGAEFLCKQLAKSQVPKVAAVSCNPLTLARDLAILTAGGYRITSVTPVDQFLWSSHVEAVALLEKPKKRR